MRWYNWRRAVALIALLVGVGVGASTTPASAAPHSAAHQVGGQTVQPFDWWWT